MHFPVMIGLQTLAAWNLSNINQPWPTLIKTHVIYSINQHMSHLVTKPTKWHVHPATTQISLGIHPVWSESSLCAWRKLGSLATHWAHSEDTDQIWWMPRLIWGFAGHTCHFVGFDMRWLIFSSQFYGPAACFETCRCSSMSHMFRS